MFTHGAWKAAAHVDHHRRVWRGHNSAARGVEEAMRGRAETRLVDLCAEAMPATFRMTRAGYLWIISACPASGS